MFVNALGLEIIQTNNLDEFNTSELPKFNYSDAKFERIISIKPHTILFDVGIKDYLIEVNNHAQYCKIFFKNSNSIVPFDLLGASFWLLTRYEEYLPYKSDKHNRFNYKSSLAYQYDFIETPLINLWLSELKNLLLNNYPELKFTSQSYNFVSTIDIDSAFKFKFKGFVRSTAGYISDILSRNLISFKLRWLVNAGKKSDPFDCYNFLIDVHKKERVEAIYFFLLGDYGPNDKNHAATNLDFQALIKGISDYSKIGIHPSFGSNKNSQQLKIEINRLANIIHNTITKSRQHYSMLKFPQTYQNILTAGILEDFSMGYTNCNGFRASYCLPYKWYSLENETATPLTINSFCLNENTLIYFSKKENKTLEELAEPLINEVKKYNGKLVSIFHNDSFSDEIKKFYVEFIKLANSKN